MWIYWISLMDINGYQWIRMDIQDGYLIQYNKSDMFRLRPVYIHEYPYISIHIHRYPTYPQGPSSQMMMSPFGEIRANFVDVYLIFSLITWEHQRIIKMQLSKSKDQKKMKYMMTEWYFIQKIMSNEIEWLIIMNLHEDKCKSDRFENPFDSIVKQVAK